MEKREQPPVVLMYRRPDSDEYEKLTDVMDDILIRLAAIENKLKEL